MLGCVLSAAASSASAQEIPGSRTTVAGWSLGAYTSKTTGRFSHCAIHASYRSGITMVFSVSDNFSWRVVWGHRNWNLQVGQSVELEMHIDGVGPYRVMAKASRSDIVSAELASTAGLFDAFRKGHMLSVRAMGNNYAFNLDGTYAALSEAVECTKRHAQGLASTTPPPMAPTARTPSAPAALPSGTPARTSFLTAEQRVEATTLVANILARANLAGFKIFNDKERSPVDDLGYNDSWDVMWRAEGVLGLLAILPKRQATSSSTVATELLAEESRVCKGRFASRSRPDERSAAVIRLVVECDDRTASTEARFIIVPLDEGGYYVFVSVGKSKDGERQESVGKVDEMLRSAVYAILRM